MVSIKNKITGKKALWIRKGAVVCGPATYDFKADLKADGARWDVENKGWSFDNDYQQAGGCLRDIAQKLGDNYIFERDEKRNENTYGGQMSSWDFFDEYDN